jgi:hypothetical protein
MRSIDHYRVNMDHIRLYFYSVFGVFIDCGYIMFINDYIQ